MTFLFTYASMFIFMLLLFSSSCLFIDFGIEIAFVMKSYAILCDLLLSRARLLLSYTYMTLLPMVEWETVTSDGLLISFHYCDQMTDMISFYSLL